MNLETVETLLQSSKGAALQDLIKQSLISPSIFHYESILTVSRNSITACMQNRTIYRIFYRKHASVKALEETPETKKYYNILKLFAYGTVTDYKNDKEVIGWELNDAESQKLKVNLQCQPYQKFTLSVSYLVRQVKSGNRNNPYIEKWGSMYYIGTPHFSIYGLFLLPDFTTFNPKMGLSQ